MSNVTVWQMPAFKKVYKKLHPQTRQSVNKAIKMVMDDPKRGIEKKGDLSGVFVYKFKVNQQEYLLAYETAPRKRILLYLGAHENFYRDLKRIK